MAYFPGPGYFPGPYGYTSPAFDPALVTQRAADREAAKAAYMEAEAAAEAARAAERENFRRAMEEAEAADAEWRQHMYDNEINGMVARIKAAEAALADMNAELARIQEAKQKDMELEMDRRARCGPPPPPAGNESRPTEQSSD
eukprot:NODE_2018_length_671_cov_22.716912_g1968_i0.p1 GENE.NODE_2018_length_671_cov_22.716912_g1968_i0~~NODE_2018_length_671_cov_22.716912_g1968_i0.p1  ORF type:complete len:143 (+),score=66.81 NODE_2018_length_671_cov_22.716912_g1968_i0:85-513(+)